MTTDFWDRDLDDIEADFLPQGKKITDLPIQHSIDGIPVETILNDFAKNLLENQQPLDPEFQKVLDDNYWELITDTDTKDKEPD